MKPHPKASNAEPQGENAPNPLGAIARRPRLSIRSFMRSQASDPILELGCRPFDGATGFVPPRRTGQ